MIDEMVFMSERNYWILMASNKHTSEHDKSR